MAPDPGAAGRRAALWLESAPAPAPAPADPISPTTPHPCAPSAMHAPCGSVCHGADFPAFCWPACLWILFKRVFDNFVLVVSLAWKKKFPDDCTGQSSELKTRKYAGGTVNVLQIQLPYPKVKRSFHKLARVSIMSRFISTKRALMSIRVLLYPGGDFFRPLFENRHVSKLRAA